MSCLEVSPSLLFWTDPVQSGAVFGSVLVFLVSICYNSLITVVSYTFLTILLMISVVRLYTYVMVTFKKADASNDPLSTISNLPLTIPPKIVSEMSPCIASGINSFISELRRLFFIDNLVDSIQFGLSLWCLTYIGSWFNAITIIILAWVGAFTLPKLYKNNEEQVDKVIAQITSQFEEVKEKIISTIPGMKKSEKQE
eukprot:TRINITY_DN2896_c0_g1_i1.p1 TRINITY_DN2896_c0_g1~~TRINITY_DN2896_c0_g1_i1.p1  ORF type:complete len:198 (-),score=60.85 TRINITY_DN2896_c0_g1_i1:97-690(-)